nr:acyl carrier protein [Gammaproteobacteria bacterium]
MNIDALPRIVSEVLGIPIEAVSEALSSDETPEWDSLNHLRLITALEEELSIQLTMDEVVAAKTNYGNLRDIVSKRMDN